METKDIRPKAYGYDRYGYDREGHGRAVAISGYFLL